MLFERSEVAWWKFECLVICFGGFCHVVWLTSDPASSILHSLAIPFWLKSYATALSQFLSFCCQLGRIHSSGSPCPADEWTLCLFVTFLAGSLQHSSIKVYLFGMRALHIKQGFADPLPNCLRLQHVIRSIKRTQGSPSSSRLPITDDLILVIWKSLNLQFPDHSMFWAGCSWGILGSTVRRIQSLLRQVSPPCFIWTCRISQWTPVQIPHASSSLSRPQRRIHSARAAPFILALFMRCWLTWLSVVKGRPSVSLSKRATSLAYSTLQLALANYGLCRNFW